jgi:hypothetical protein
VRVGGQGALTGWQARAGRPERCGDGRKGLALGTPLRVRSLSARPPLVGARPHAAPQGFGGFRVRPLARGPTRPACSMLHSAASPRPRLPRAQAHLRRSRARLSSRTTLVLASSLGLWWGEGGGRGWMRVRFSFSGRGEDERRRWRSKRKTAGGHQARRVLLLWCPANAAARLAACSPPRASGRPRRTACSTLALLVLIDPGGRTAYVIEAVGPMRSSRKL